MRLSAIKNIEVNFPTKGDGISRKERYFIKFDLRFSGSRNRMGLSALKNCVVDFSIKGRVLSTGKG
jgi:hypothetical protein